MISIYNSFASIESLQEKLATDICESFSSHKTQKQLFLLSGGSTLEICDKLVDILIYDDRLSDDFYTNLIITFIDERFDPANANFNSFEKSKAYAFFKNKGAQIPHIEDFSKQGSVVAQEMDTLFSRSIKEKYYIHGLIGMGADGHTAGIMPYPENKKYFEKTFVNTDRYAVYFDATGKNEFTRRITATIPFILYIAKAFCYVTGIQKAQKLQEAIHPKTDISTVPFAIIQKMKDVAIYSDIRITKD